MNTEQTRLYQKILAYSPDRADSQFPFSARLARENGWNRSFARRVIEEYKRFMFLAVAADHMVTPSEEVDQAWHLHLVYTRSYWADFCDGVLGRPVHHEPTTGGAAESAHYRSLYEKTLDSYEQWFNESPPSDIWPPTAVRFDPTLHR